MLIVCKIEDFYFFLIILRIWGKLYVYLGKKNILVYNMFFLRNFFLGNLYFFKIVLWSLRLGLRNFFYMEDNCYMWIGNLRF